MAAERGILLQLARLGDVVQSLPAYVGVRAAQPQRPIDLLCAAPLAPLAGRFPAVERVVPWDGAQWHAWTHRWAADSAGVTREMTQYATSMIPQRYAVAFNLNQHGRATVLAHLCADRVVGPGSEGVLNPTLPTWAEYVRGVARSRGANRVHLADAFCGLCGVRPPSAPPRLDVTDVVLPTDVSAIGQGEGPWVTVVLGAGDAERVIPSAIWRQWIDQFLAVCPTGQVVLIGAGAERETARTILDALSGLQQSRLWDTTGRLSLPQLAACLARCQWVIGGDTGPLHLGAAVGARAVGWFLARARVHETGPYGTGHVVWQVEPAGGETVPTQPSQWPILESVEWVASQRAEGNCEGWSVWHSGFDEWGTWYRSASDESRVADRQREQVWKALSPSLTEVVA